VSDKKTSGKGRGTFRIGDWVSWKSHGSKAEGQIEDKITSATKVAGRKVAATKEEPQYLVRSKKSGGTAVHKPSALTRLKARASAAKAGKAKAGPTKSKATLAKSKVKPGKSKAKKR